MCGYATYQDPRLQPDPEPEPTPADALASCAHQGACLRAGGRLCHGTDGTDLSWAPDAETARARAARWLACGDCDEWEGM